MLFLLGIYPGRDCSAAGPCAPKRASSPLSHDKLGRSPRESRPFETHDRFDLCIIYRQNVRLARGVRTRIYIRAVSVTCLRAPPPVSAGALPLKRAAGVDSIEVNSFQNVFREYLVAADPRSGGSRDLLAAVARASSRRIQPKCQRSSSRMEPNSEHPLASQSAQLERRHADRLGRNSVRHVG